MGRQSQFATSCAGRPRKPSRLAGRRYNRPGSRGFPSGPSPGSWAWTETPPESTPWRRLRLERNSVQRSVPKQRPWPDHQPPPTKPGDIFAFHLRGHNRWTTTPVARVFHPTVNQVLGQLFMVTPRRILITVLGGEVSRESFPPHALVWV